MKAIRDCTTCDHRNICKYEGEMDHIKSEIDRLLVDSFGNDVGHFSVMLKCENYQGSADDIDLITFSTKPRSPKGGA